MAKIETKDLAKRIADKFMIKESFARKILDFTINEIKQEIKNKNSVNLRSFVTFKPSIRSEKEIYIPGTTKKIKVEKKLRFNTIISSAMKKYLSE